MSHKNIVLILLAISALACKTQEDIKRERTMDTINEKIAQTQQSTASTSSRFLPLEEQIAKLNGTIEELSHNKGQDQKDLQLLKDRIVVMEETNKKQSENIKVLADKVNEQTKYIEQVIKSLTELSNKKEVEPVKEITKKKTEKEEKPAKENNVKSGISLYKAHEYAESRAVFEDLLENAKMSKKDKGACLFFLGLIEYKEKKYEEAKIYFSRLFTEIPDSQYNAGALLNLAKSFIQLKSNEEAKQSLEELIIRYPKSKEAQEAARMKAKL